MASAKRRRCDTESGHGGRVFNPSWTTDYFVLEQSNSIMSNLFGENCRV